MSRRLFAKAEELLGKEAGTVFKSPEGKTNVCLVYPNTYHVGMSNLGFQGVYTMLNERPDVVCERAFLPDPEDMEEHERTGTGVFSLESRRPLGRFDVVAFSVSFENDYPNIIRILSLSKIPLESRERGPGHPLVAMGGVCAFSNPEPLAPFFDVVFVGEAEGMLDEFMDVYEASSLREGLYQKAAMLEGVYLPALYDVEYDGQGFIARRLARGGAPDTIRRRYARDISARPLRASITTPATEFSNMILIEAMRGCPWDCNFCLAGHVYNPPRKKSLEALTAEIREAMGRTARVGLIGPSLADYPHCEDVLGIEGVDFSITSLRAGRKSAALAARLRGRKSVSIAPEAGTDRLRRMINKKLTEEDIVETSRQMLEGGVERLRLYFMVGLPTETEEDMEGVVDLVNKIRGSSRRGKVVLSVSTFVPKPSTPFQWHPMLPLKTVKARLGAIKGGLRSLKGVSVFHDVPKYAHLQGVLSLGDRRVSALLRAMQARGDGGDWRRAASEAGVDADFYIMRHRGPGEILPWDFIDSGISKERLRRIHDEALSLEGPGGGSR